MGEPEVSQREFATLCTFDPAVASQAVYGAGRSALERGKTSLLPTIATMPKPVKTLRASDPVTSDARGQWLVLIGDGGETSAEDIEAFFADIWPDVEPEATIQ